MRRDASRIRRTAAVSATLLALTAGVANADPTAAPGWALRAIPTPEPVQGGVLRFGEALIVGQGSFGAGAQRIVRIVGDEIVTIATGFNSLGGFAWAPDGALLVVDNGGDLSGATSGDTLYAIPDPLGRTTPIAATDAIVLPSGTLPFAQDVAVLPDGRVVVSESVGPGAGRLAIVSGTTVTTLVDGLDYASGLAVHGDRVLVANVNAAFRGAVRRFSFDGVEHDPLVSSLSGAFALDGDPEGAVLVSGGFADDGSSTLVAIGADGSQTERVRGFGFTTELFSDVARDEVLLLDAGSSAVSLLCRDRDRDGVCDRFQRCTPNSDATLRIHPRGRIHGPLPAPGLLKIRGRLIFTDNLPRAEPRQSGLRVRIFGANDDVLLAAKAAPGRDWQRQPQGGWTYIVPVEAGGPLGLRVTVGKDDANGQFYASVRFATPTTVAGDGWLTIELDLGDRCGVATRYCRLRRWARKNRAEYYRMRCT